MAALVKTIGSQLVYWVKQATQKNKMPYRWFEVEHCGM
jgi:hypothetical protein